VAKPFIFSFKSIVVHRGSVVQVWWARLHAASLQGLL